MASATRLTPHVSEMLSQLRQQVRKYVCVEGIAVAVVCLVATYWVALCLDYLPVRLGANEMPQAARGALLLLIGLALLAILYRWILRRLWVRLRDRSLALLVERKFPEFQESLLTAVELHDPSESSLQESMLETARAKAERCAAAVNVDEVFDYWPLRRAVGLASTALLTLLVFGILAWPTFALSISRLYGMSEATYPRQTFLEMVGFPDGTVTVARGSDLTIRVQADAARPQPPPNVCTIYYTTASGERGRINMNKKGASRDGFQQYTFDAKPFKGILADVHFDVVGNDYRIRDQRVCVVDSPQVVNVEISCEKPAYTQLSTSRSAYYPGIRLPLGSRLNVSIETNKPLVSAVVTDMVAATAENSNRPSATTDDASAGSATPDVTTLVPAEGKTNVVSFTIDRLDDNLRYAVELADTDGVESTRPYVLSIVAVPDAVPQVELRLTGIGSAITQDARLPVEGRITDDYGVDQTWFELELPEKPSRQFAMQQQPGGKVNTDLDLREQRAAQDDTLHLDVDTKVVLSFRASDGYDLGEAPNVGQSDRYELEVVLPNQLIALLEARELGLRRRFEQIILEFRETRDSLNRVQFKGDSDQEAAALANETAEDPVLDNVDSVQRAAALRRLRVQRAEQHSQRAAQEILGVALSFEDIRQEIINNRIDANDRKERIQTQIADPLKQITAELFPILDSRLLRLTKSLDEARAEVEITAAATAAVAQSDEILFALEAVLEKMLELETYNELVDLLRSLIRDQEDLNDRTKDQQKKSALDLLN